MPISRPASVLSACLCALPALVPAGARAQCGLNFASAQTYPTGGGTPQAIAIADFNSDGILDLAVANSSAGGVSILLGQGGGTFGAFSNVPVSGTLRSIVVADLNNDTIPDIAAVSANSTVTALLGLGNGQFSGPIVTGIGGSQTVAVDAADLTGDGIIDLAVVSQGSNSVSLLRGLGGGSFASPVTFTVGASPRCVVIGDINNDGIPDIVVGNQSSNDVSILRGLGGGAFSTATTTPVGLPVRSVALGDLNGDGRPDIIVGANSGPNVAVLLANGSGGFGGANFFGASAGPLAIAVADMNGDGHLDVVAAAGGSASAVVLLGNGTGTLQFAIGLPVSGNPGAIAVGALENSGGPDLAVGNGSGSVSVLLNVASPVTISQQPTSCQLVQAGQPLNLGVAASGSGTLSYHWRLGGVPLVDGGRVSGATTASLQINPSAGADTGAYDVVVTSSCGGQQATSAAAIVAVPGGDPCAGQLPQVAQQPANRQALTGATVTFSVGAAAPGVTYQWRRAGVALSNGGSISGATSPTLSVGPLSLSDNGAALDCVLTNSCGSTRSNPAGLAVTPRCPTDVDQNGQVQTADVGVFITNWFAALANGC